MWRPSSPPPREAAAAAALCRPTHGTHGAAIDGARARPALAACLTAERAWWRPPRRAPPQPGGALRRHRAALAAWALGDLAAATSCGAWGAMGAMAVAEAAERAIGGVAESMLQLTRCAALRLVAAAAGAEPPPPDLLRYTHTPQDLYFPPGGLLFGLAGCCAAPT